jgi:alkylation response protein AidB-like acyl-CoA dehydrogenase
MITKTNWITTMQEIGPQIAARAEHYDRESAFVAENYELLKSVGAMSAAVPGALGGGDADHREVCEMLRELAHHCPSTALALSMHSHLVAATVWKHRQGKGGEELLRRVADEQIVLLSTGGADWVESNGVMERVEGGYRVTARKIFGSGSPAADVMITSSRYQHPREGWQVLHFPVPMRAEGVRVLDDWNSFGMRGTGSNTVLLENVFVPDENIQLHRPAGQWHPVWSMVVIVALPIFLGPYVGVAESARDLAVEQARKQPATHADGLLPQLLGELEGHLMQARLAWRDMIRTTDDYRFENTLELANRTLIQKSLLARACVATVQKAMEVAGGRSFARGFGMERLLRDVMAVTFHPLTEKKQLVFSGRVALGLDPVTGAPPG